MKKNTIPALAAALCLLCTGIPVSGVPETVSLISASAADKLTSGVLTYTIENDAVIITGCEKTAETVEIPAEIDGMPVTAVGATAFYGLDVTSVTIPEGVTSIGSGAFWHCKKLQSVKLPSTLTEIAAHGFTDCQELEELSIPKSVNAIGADAFTDTPWLEAQKKKSGFVIVNGILIDATAAVAAEQEKIAEQKKADANSRDNVLKWREPGKRNDIITNQVGYITGLVKHATLVSDSKDPVAFELVNDKGETVFDGKTKPFGLDKTSGDNVHIIDFTEFKTPGTYSLKVGEAASRAFKIGVGEEYSGLMYDALNYFYQNRSGIEIKAEYLTSGDPEELVRKEAHNPDTGVIQMAWGYEGSSGKQEVTGGWYDAGDHGKYVVNGGIALWMMQNQYEMNPTDPAYADGAMKIPENGNKYPDLLDEARYEMEWMFTMLVQDGDYKNMAYHKVHDDKWTGLGLDPANDMQKRYLMPPSTAATLNLAACAAQSARLWKELDPEYAEKCLTVAKDCYEAAKKHPEEYAPNKELGGGGAYSDSNVTDEFYWAACELFITTGDAAYYDDLKKSDHAFKLADRMGEGSLGLDGVFDWGNTAALGTLSLALNPKSIDEKEAAQITENISKTADAYIAYQTSTGYEVPYQGSVDKSGYEGYVWGSNSFVADDGVMLSYAHYLTKDEKYLNAAVGAMDYILGRNALDFSYVTGYGEHSAQYPHHRFWAKMSNQKFAKAPCGVLVGGPNSSIQDPIMEESGCVNGETPTQLCYLDHNEAYSVNECAINWNAPLAWLSGYLAKEGDGLKAGQASCGKPLEELPAPDPNYVDPLTITIPDGVVTVGEQIFGKQADAVTEVSVPDSVKNISKEAFFRCGNLSAISVPKTIEEVGDNAFAETPWLEEQLKDSPLLILNGILIDGTSAKGDVEIPDTVKKILGSSFKLNKKITSVTIADSVESIGSSAFYGCEKLASVKFPKNVRTIGESAFANTPITELTIPESVKEIGAEAFINCKSLPSVTVLGKNVAIGKEAFGCTSTFTANGQYSYLFIHDVLADFAVTAPEGSTAAAYAKEMGFAFKASGASAEVKDGLGDVNADGIVDIMDCILLNKHLLGAAELTKEQNAAADVDGSGTVDAQDSLNILKYALEIIKDFTSLT
jgi:hypothetical protein